MKSNTRTVLAETLSSVSSYSSGPLDVGDLDVLFVSVYATAVSGSPIIAVSVVDANGNTVKVADITPGINQNHAVCIGRSSTYAVLGTNSGVPYFGDQVQLDLTGSATISAQLSVKGK